MTNDKTRTPLTERGDFIIVDVETLPFPAPNSNELLIVTPMPFGIEVARLSANEFADP